MGQWCMQRVVIKVGNIGTSTSDWNVNIKITLYIMKIFFKDKIKMIYFYDASSGY